jgi:hypothetical protein
MAFLWFSVGTAAADAVSDWNAVAGMNQSMGGMMDGRNHGRNSRGNSSTRRSDPGLTSRETRHAHA